MGLALQKREQRAALVSKARAILDLAEKEGRAITAEESSSYDAIMSDVDKLKGEIDRQERVSAAESDIRAAIGAAPRAFGGGDKAADRSRAVRSFLRGETREAVLELRALQADSLEAGGALVKPEDFVAKLIKFTDDELFVRRLATMIPMSQSASMGIPTLEADPDDADWTSELGTGDEDSSMSFGKRELRPYPLAKRIKVSEKLLSNASLDPENLVAGRLAYKFAVSQEKAFLTGNGAGRPLGVFVASDNGIKTARDTTTASSTVFTGDELIDTVFSLKPQYLGKAQWLMHRDTLARVRKLKDAQGQYLWSPGLGGQPDTLLTRPINLSEHAPNTFTAGNYVAILGDWSHYWIAEVMGMNLKRLNELYAATGQVGFIGRQEIDGQPVMSEAFSRLKLKP